MTRSDQTLRRLAAITVLMSLAACGGGGDSASPSNGDGGTPPVLPPPAPPPEPPAPPPPPTPTPPAPPAPPVATAIPRTVAAASGFFVALDQAGQGLVWGTLTDALGNGPTLPQSAARTVAISAISVEAGSTYTLAAGKDGVAYVWGGFSSIGALGDFALTQNGSTPPVEAPIALPGVDSVVQVGTAVGSVNGSSGWGYSLALRADGTVWHWPGVVTYDSSDPANVKAKVAPGQIAGLSNVVALSRHGNGGQALAIKADGTVWKISLAGQGSALSVITHSGTATQVTGVAGATEADCAGGLTCLALTADGKVIAWGDNTFGQLGNGGTSTAFSPVEVAGLPPAKAVSSYAGTSCALSQDGNLWYWGINPGNGNLAPVLVPTLLTTIDAVVEFDFCTLMMRRSDGTVWGLGSNNASQLGGGVAAPDFVTPEPVPGIQLN